MLTKAHLRRAHLSCHLLVGTLRFADPHAAAQRKLRNLFPPAPLFART
jgi:hypothetical protein